MNWPEIIEDGNEFPGVVYTEAEVAEVFDDACKAIATAAQKASESLRGVAAASHALANHLTRIQDDAVLSQDFIGIEEGEGKAI